MPPKHKEKNKIRFLPFADRIANINVDVIHRIGHRYEEDREEEVECYFRLALEKWENLNCSRGFKEFYSEVKNVETLAQLVLLRERVATTLLNHLEKRDPLTIQTLLDMVVAFARDIRKDFYPFYPDFLSKIISFLACKEAEVLEWSFHCLAYLFKFLWRCMVRNVKPVLSSLLPLLSPKRPQYIHYFAADSFSFLARKVKDPAAFLSLILDHLKEQPEDVEGCGRLVFAWLKGIRGQLHSCSKSVLLIMMQSFGNDSLPTDLLESLFSNVLSHLVVEIQPGGLTVLCEAIQVSVNQFYGIYNSGKSKSCEALGRTLRLVHQLCRHTDAIHITSPVSLVDLLLPIYGASSPLPDEILSEMASITAILLMSPTVRLPQDRTVKLSAKVLAVSPPGIILSFVKEILNWSSLETLILPRLLEIVAGGFISGNDNDLGLQILAQLVQAKVPSLFQDHNEPNLVSYNLDFTSASRGGAFKAEDIFTKLLSLLKITKKSDVSLLLTSLRERIYAIRVLPHIKPLNVKKALETLQIQISYLCQEMKLISSTSEENVELNVQSQKQLSQLLLLLGASLEAVIRLNEPGKDLALLLDLNLVLETLLPLSKLGSCRLSALQLLNLYLGFVDLENRKDADKISLSIYESLKLNLSAPHHLVREMTCCVLCKLPLAQELSTMFRLCLDAEVTEVTITNYRDKIQYLQKLSFETAQIFLVRHPEYRMAPLYFILGSLYVNFQLLWEPLKTLISSYAISMPSTDFWPTFHAQLALATEQRDYSSDHGTAPAIKFDCPLLDEYYSTLNTVDDRPDHAHYRLLLWDSCHDFPEICEQKHRDISVLFLTFMKNEYYAANADVANSWDIKKHTDMSSSDDAHTESQEAEEDEDSCDEEDQEEVKDEDESMDVEDDATEPKRPRGRKSRASSLLQSDEKPSARFLTKTLLSKLKLFSKMKNPRGIYREPEVNQVYQDLLSNKNPDIQKAALECIFTYKHKYLTPYSQNLLSLIDNKAFKNEVTRFSIDKDSGAIQEEHRPKLIPIIMKLVYSKMVAKTGMRTGGKAGPAMRRALVFRFLAGCNEEEMLIFVKMAFRFFDQYLRDDLSVMVDSIQANIDLEKVVPPRRLQSVVNLLSVVQERFGGLMGNRLLSLILQLLTCVGATVDGILKHRSDIHVGFLNVLRGLRTSCIEVLTQFFERFEAYPWTSCEIDTVLRVFVFPIVDLLPIEGVHSPTALLKLFSVWGQHPRYFILFGSHASSSPECNPLSAIMKLLLGAKTHHVVCGSIMEILENMLTLKDHKQLDENDMEVDETYLEERAPPISVSHVLPLNEKEISDLNLPGEVNLGSKLLFPHISSILEKFRIRLAASSKKGSGLNKLELRVLSCLSEFVRAPDTSATLADLLLPILTRRIAAPHEEEEVVLKMINTLNFLVKNVEKPYIYTRPIAALFSCISGVAGRKMLVSLVHSIAESTTAVFENLKEEMEQLTSIVSRLNAFDRRWVEQPDFDTRLDAFKSAQDLADQGKLSVDLGAIVIHQCFHVIRTEKDLSLKDFATHCLRKVAPMLCLQHGNDATTTKFLVDTTVLTLIRNAIGKPSLETLHSEGVLLLGEMARECPNLHPVLKDLNLLTNKADLEVDFFENMQHMQFHRRTRALLRISDVLKSVESAPNPRTLTQFILPLVSQYICAENHTGKNSLIDAAIQAIGTMARLLPWHQYETVLRYYLGRLQNSSLFQKQLSRIVMVVLDAFHFDLSKASVMNGSGNSNKNEAILSHPVGKANGIEDVPEEKDEANETQADGEPLVEDLLEQMDIEEDKDAETEMTVETESVKTVLAIERQSTLCPSLASRVINIISTGLLPQLQRALAARTLIESVHKVNKKQAKQANHDRDAEEEEILRVPMAFAIVKLLQRLPKVMLTRNLPGVLIKLCTFLKSRLESVRRVTKETLQKVMISLGPSYLSTLLHEMTTLLTRGFQVHVLIYCLHAVLITLKETFKHGDIDDSITYIIEVCKHGLFGYAAEEREEGKVASKVHEAQSTKSYNTLLLTAQFVSEGYLTNLLIPFKEIIQSTHSHKIVKRASECLRQIVLGLSENKLIPPSSLLVFAVGVANESIPALTLKSRIKEKTKKEKEIEARQKPDCFIIQEAPKQRIGITSTDAAKVAARMNAHVFVEFGLRLIYFQLKHEKLKEFDQDVRPLLDPLVPLFNDCLSSQHVKLSTISMQCLSWLLKMDLPSLRSTISSITASMFSLLHKFAAAGLSKGDNFDLVVAAFKAVAVLVRDVKYHTLDQDQLKALLLYAEQDVADAHKHATAFTLLKAILSRKLIVPEIHDVMEKVATLSITSDLIHVRIQARQVFHQFLMDYPLGKKLEKHLSFYLSQMNYELQPGRESALEMVNSIISSFPLSVLSKQCGLFFLTLGARLVNDDSPECRKMVAQCIGKMLSRLPNNDRDRLFNIGLLWLQDKKVSHRRLAAQLCGLFVICEKEEFERHLPQLLPAVIAQFSFNCSDESEGNPGAFVKAPSMVETERKFLQNDDEIEGSSKQVSESERMRDHHVYQVMQLVLKICNHCPSWLLNREYSSHVYNLTEHAQSLLAHPHEWVRLSAAQTLTHILNALNIEALSMVVNNTGTLSLKTEGLGFFAENTAQRLKSMILDHCAQFTPGADVGQQLLLQIVKNLIIFADVLKNTSEGDDKNIGNVEEADEKNKFVSLVWLTKRMRRVANMEVVQAPRSTTMRTMFLNWAAATVVKLGGECIRPVLHHILAPIVRELSSDEPAPEGSAIAQLRKLAKEVGSLIKKTVGTQFFLQTQAQLQTQIESVRAQRRIKRKQEAVAEPEKAAKRKIQKQIKKKESKKLARLKKHGKKFKKKKEISLEDD